MYKKLAKLLLIYSGLVVFLLSTNPTNVSVIVLLVPIIWLFFALYYTFITVIGLLNNSKQNDQAKTNTRIISLILASIPTTLLLLNSISQLTARDTTIVLILGIGLVFYASRFKLVK